MQYVFVALIVFVLVAVFYFLPEKPPLRALPPDVFTRFRCVKCGEAWHAETGKAPCSAGGQCEIPAARNG